MGDGDHNPSILEKSKDNHRSPKIYIAALNALTLKSDENLLELTYALNQIKWDIVGLSEVRRIGERIISHPDFLLYHIGTTLGHHGVGFIIKNYLISYIDGFIGISERIAMVNLKLPGYKDAWSIIQIYSPTEKSDLETINSFYSELNKTIQEHAHKNLIVMGDFNGQIGVRRPEENTIIGPFTYSNKPRSRNGEKITNFAKGNNLIILNTMYKKKKNKMWTWISPDGKIKNEIDFMMTNKSNYFTNFNIISKFNFNTNHRLIRAELKTIQPKKPRPRHKLDKDKLSKFQMDQLEVALKEKIKNFKEETKNLSTQEKYDWIENTINTQIKLCSKSTQQKIWLSTNTINLLEQRNNLISSRDAIDRRRRLAEISKKIRESTRLDRKRHRLETIEYFINESGGVKKAFKALTNSKDWIVKFKNKSGEYNQRRTGILSIATDYYKKLYECCNLQDLVDLKDNSNVPCILRAEVEKVIDSQPIAKAPGPDGIRNEVIKHCKEVLTPVLTDIFNDIINTEIIPQQWTESNIILLYKKGDKYEIGNYRPISLMSNLYKIFAKTLLKRIEGPLDEHQPIEQAGFRKDFSVIDHIHAVRQILEKYKEYQLIYYIAFIDYSKAFDSLYHGAIWEALTEQGVEHKYIRLIKNVYQNSSAKIQLEKTGIPFKVSKGVRQGDPLSPKLFSAVLESIFRRLDWDNLGIKVNGKLLTHLRFADDIVLFANTPEKICNMINELARESEKAGLRLNPEKTRVISNGEEHPIKLGKAPIDYTDEYIYLGQLMTQNNAVNKEVERRITNGWKRYWSLKEIMKDKKLNIRIKSKLFNSCVLPVLMYGSQTWTLTQKNIGKLANCQHAMERSMLSVKKSDRLKNKVIRNKTKVHDITHKIKRLKWRWTGHMIRGKDKWSKLTTQWYPREGKRKKGRPQKRWDDDIKHVAGTTWNRVAQDRHEWKRLEEAFADWQTDLQKTSKRQIID